MNPTTQATIRISDAATAIGMNTKALRNWMKKVQFIEDRDNERGWRSFSFLDVAILAVMKQAVAFGFEVEDAEEFSGAAILKALGPLVQSKNLPPRAMLAALTGKFLHLYHASDEDMMVLTNFNEVPPRYPARLTIDLHTTVTCALAELQRTGRYSLDGLKFGDPIPLDKAALNEAAPTEATVDA